MPTWFETIINGILNSFQMTGRARVAESQMFLQHNYTLANETLSGYQPTDIAQNPFLIMVVSIWDIFMAILGLFMWFILHIDVLFCIIELGIIALTLMYSKSFIERVVYFLQMNLYILNIIWSIVTTVISIVISIGSMVANLVGSIVKFLISTFGLGALAGI